MCLIWKDKGYGAGSTSALFIALNMETYERMAGPSPMIGVKLLIYNQTSLPIVNKRNLELPPGYNSLIGVSYHQVRESE